MEPTAEFFAVKLHGIIGEVATREDYVFLDGEPKDEHRTLREKESIPMSELEAWKLKVAVWNEGLDELEAKTGQDIASLEFRICVSDGRV